MQLGDTLLVQPNVGELKTGMKKRRTGENDLAPAAS
jgi:hypothetical protein